MVQVLTTSPKHRWHPAKDLAFTKPTGAGKDLIKVDLAKSHQEMLGFGAAFTDSACWLFSKLPAGKRNALFTELFSPTGLGLNVCRCCVGASDYARNSYSLDDTKDDFELKDFSIDHDRAYIIPMMLQAKAVNPEMFLFSSPWSPPAWMKSPDTFHGGWMREKYLEVFARYYFRFLQDYAAAGVPMQALTPQNEVETDQISKMPACFWHPEYEAALVRDHLGPMIKKAGLDTKIWLLDHNYIMWQRPKWQLNDPGVKKYTDGVAFHAYGGTADMMSKLHDAHPDIHLYWTEGGPGITKTYETEWCKWSAQITDALRNWCRSYTGWNLALDENGNPNIGPFKCAGLVTIGSKDKKVRYSGQYYALGHFSKFLRRGARVVGSTGEIDGIKHVAAVNPDGQRVLIVTNTGKPQTVRIREGRNELKLKLEGDSVTTLTWNT